MGNEFCQGCNEVFSDGKSLGENNLTKKQNLPITNIKNPFFFKNNASSSIIEHQTNTESIINNNNKTESFITTMNNPLPAEVEPKLIKNGKMTSLNTYNSNIKNSNNNNINNVFNSYNGHFNKNINEENKFDENNNINNDYNNFNKTENENYNFYNNNSEEDDNDNNFNTMRNTNFLNNENNINTLNNNLNNNIFKENEEKKQANIEDISARKITKLFRQFLYAKRLAHTQLFRDMSVIPSSEYIIGLNNDKLDINLAPENKCIYLGTKFNNQKDGLGLELFTDSNAKYFGIFNNGKRKDAGIFNINNSLKNYTYKGQVNGIYAFGYGWFFDKKESKEYEGMWDKSMKNGYGIEKYNDNSEYRGSFVNGKKEGIGIYQWNDNSYYEGEWKENKLSGFGIYKFNDGSIYEGQWKRSRFHGFGEFTYPGIKKYYGFFQKDKRFGFGIEIWLKIEKAFIGFWKDNNMDGFGKFIVNDKKRYGIWKEGKLVEKFHNKKDFYKKIKDEKIDFINYFQYDDYKSVFNLIDGNI